MTERIRARCGKFSVRLVKQQLGRAYADEMAVLPLREDEVVWIREVLLLADGRPVVFGRSLLPRGGSRGTWRLFHRRGSRPLGEDLFNNPRIRRTKLRSTCLDCRDARYHCVQSAAALSGAPGQLWARRSLFVLDKRPLMVSEVFLPAILDLPV